MKKQKVTVVQAFKEFIWPRKGIVFVGLILIVISRLASLVLPLKSKELLDEIIPNQDMDALIAMVMLVAGAILVQATTSFALTRLLSVEAQLLISKLRAKVQKQVLSLPISYFDNNKSGALVSRIMSDVEGVRNLVGTGLVQLFGGTITAIISLFLLINISGKMTLFVLAPVFLFAVIALKAFAYIRPIFRKRGVINAEVTGRLTETLNGVRVIKGFNAEKVFGNKFKESTLRFEKLMNKLLTRTQLAAPVSEILGIMVFCVLIWYGGSLVLVEKTIPPSAFIPFLGFAYNIITPAKSISKASFTIKKGNAAAERILDILETQDPLQDSPNAIDKTDFNSEIEFKNVSFKYQEEYVLKDFSLKVPKGTSVALVGQSGSGKSTLANLVTRFYDVNNGSITVDGNNVKDISKKSLLGLMGIVTQDSILFNDSVSENIKLGKQDATAKEIRNASEIANAHEFVKELPEQYDTNIGDGGNKLSGGQKQRLSIARAVLKNPPIMILDEATSALDTESEQLVQIALEKMMKNRTSLVIAHRLSTIQNADNIVVMRKGSIVEQGKHDELLDKKGEYFKLVTMQTLQ